MDFAAFDRELRDWASKNGLHVATKYRDEEVRSITVVNAAGQASQIWLEIAAGEASIRASSNEGRKARGWNSKAVLPGELGAALDAALDEVQRWGRE